MNSFIEWLKSHGVPCFYKEIFGYECPGCGMQTAFILLLEGRFSESFFAYPPLLFVAFLLLFFFVHIIFDIKKGDLILKWTFRLTAFVTIVSYVIKLNV